MPGVRTAHWVVALVGAATATLWAPAKKTAGHYSCSQGKSPLGVYVGRHQPEESSQLTTNSVCFAVTSCFARIIRRVK